MKNAERIVILSIIALLIGGSVWGYQAVKQKRIDYRDRVAAGEFEIRDDAEDVSATTSQSEAEWRKFYPVTYPMLVSDVKVEASVADTLSKRIKGLSGTPYLPDNVVKLFAFGVPGQHSIWMKDMRYPLDIIWADEEGLIVHIEENVSQYTYDAQAPQNSKTFKSLVDAWFVVETNAGFVAKHQVVVGDSIVIPTRS